MLAARVGQVPGGHDQRVPHRPAHEAVAALDVLVQPERRLPRAHVDAVESVQPHALPSGLRRARLRRDWRVRARA